MSQESTVSQEVYPHVYLWNAHLRLREVWDEGAHQQGGHIAVASLCFAYMAFEAFVNFCGEIVLPEIWAKERRHFRKMQGPEIENKIAELAKALPGFRWEKDQRPFESIGIVRDFRNLLAHGKLLKSEFTTAWTEDPTQREWRIPWFEPIEEDAFVRSVSDIREFSQSLLEEVRKVSDHLQLVFDAYEGPFGSREEEGPTLGIARSC